MVVGSISTSNLPLHVLDGLFYSFGEETIYQMMTTFETMTMLANLATKLTVTAGVFVIDTWTPVMINVTA